MFTIRMEIAFDDDPLTRPGTWTRIDTTCPVRKLSTVRGVNMKTGDFETGEATALVDNQTRDLDPSYASGTWYPDLTLRKRVRFSYDDGAGNVTVIWTGYLDRLPNAWDLSTTDGWVEVSAVDMLAILADKQLPPSVLHQTIVDHEPVAYWPLAETQGTSADDVVGTWDGTYRRAVTDTQQIMPYDTQAKVRFGTPSADDPLGQAVSIPGFGASSTLTVSAWVFVESTISSSVWIQNQSSTPQDSDASEPQFMIGIGTTSVVTVLDDGSTNAVGFQAGDYYGLHHIAVTIDTGVSADPDVGVYPVNMYVDGANVGWRQTDPDNPVDPFASVNVDTALAGADNAWIGYGISASSVGTERTAVVADVAYWDSALTAANIRSIYEAGVEAWSGDTTGTRLGRILDVLGVDAGDRDLDTGAEYCGPTFLGGNALDYLRRIVATEGGTLFVAPDGKLTFTEKPENDPTPLDVIGDSGCPYSAITLDYSLDRMVNTANVTRENRVTHTYSDSTAVTAFGPRSLEIDTLHASPSGARSRAAELVIRNKDLRTQILDVELKGRRSDVPSTVSIDTEINDPYTVQYQPPTGAAGTALVRVQRIEHSFVPGDWSVRFGVDQQVVFPTFAWGTAGQGWDQAVWGEP